jgi:hypothetical protein
MTTPAQQMDALLDALVGFARQMLEERGEFYPFAAEITAEGALQMVTADLAADRPASEVVLASLEARLHAAAEAGWVLATGVCADVRAAADTGELEGDAIRVDIEHSAAGPVRVFLPYTVDGSGRRAYGDPIAEAGRRRVFPEAAPK